MGQEARPLHDGEGGAAAAGLRWEGGGGAAAGLRWEDNSCFLSPAAIHHLSHRSTATTHLFLRPQLGCVLLRE